MISLRTQEDVTDAAVEHGQLRIRFDRGGNMIQANGKDLAPLGTIPHVMIREANLVAADIRKFRSAHT